jgi:hypothetical protein
MGATDPCPSHTAHPTSYTEYRERELRRRALVGDTAGYIAKVWGTYIATIKEQSRAERRERSHEKIESPKVRLHS